MDTTVRVGAVEDFPVGSFKVMDVDGVSIGLLHSGTDRWTAVRNVCPHKGAPICAGQISGTMLPSAPAELVYGLDGDVLRCPWHGWEFSLVDGKAPFLPVRGRLRLYPVSVRDAQVYLTLKRRSEPGTGRD
jgi:3-phenylpropionate/trans-cinnamate dioxygenase ferredoxin subunit